MHGNTRTQTMTGARQMFFKKSKKIKELKSLLAIYREKDRTQTNLIRVHINNNLLLRAEIKRLKKESKL